MKEFNYYLFDADGTLFDTSELIYQCFEHTSSHFGFGSISRDKVMSFIGIPLRKQMEIYFGSLSDETFEKFRKVHMGYQLKVYKEYLKLCPGVKDALVQLQQGDKRCAIVTSRLRDTLELYLKDVEIYEFFDVMVTPELTKQHKPDPEPVIRAISLLGAQSDDTIFIGDATFDIESGSRANVATAFVLWSHLNPKSLSVQPTFLIKDMRELCIPFNKKREYVQ